MLLFAFFCRVGDGVDGDTDSDNAALLPDAIVCRRRTLVAPCVACSLRPPPHAGPIARHEQGLLPALAVTSVGLRGRRQWTRVLVVAGSLVFLAMRVCSTSTC